MMRINGCVVGNGGDDPAPALVSTGSTSAYAYVVYSERLTQSTNKPVTELVEDSGGLAGQNKPPQCVDSGKFGKGGDS